MSDQVDNHEYEEEDDNISPENEPGFYTYWGGIRFYDGTDWVGDPLPPVQRFNYWLLAAAVAAGVTVGGVLAWFLVWLGAQASPEHIYLPVKFVVKELPKAFQ
jgi:hypothetical protein